MFHGQHACFQRLAGRIDPVFLDRWPRDQQNRTSAPSYNEVRWYEDVAHAQGERLYGALGVRDKYHPRTLEG